MRVPLLFFSRLDNAVARMQFPGKVPEDATTRNVEWALTAPIQQNSKEARAARALSSTPAKIE
jgi:hypothetical protein